MRQRHLFTKTRKEAPKEETAKNAKLLIRGGFIHKEMAGAYAYLPLGYRVLQRICTVIRSEMDAIGGHELHLTALQDKRIWEKTGRWSDEVVDNWFKTTLAAGGEVGLATTHEEPLTNLMTEFIHSYKDLPVYVYQFQTKFRNEKRAKSGIMRGREFLMKDLYSFSRSDEEHNEFYERAKQAYHNIFERVGIGAHTFITSASGGSFSPYSHEFQTLTDAGEDTIYLDREKKIAVNDEIYSEEVLADLGLSKENLETVTAVEVGNIFSLGTKFSDAFDLTYVDEDNKKQPVIMGSYGIGPGRLMGAIVEVLGGENEMLWPKEVAPFDLHLLQMSDDDTTYAEAEKVYRALTDAGVEVLWDDRAASAGEKFADADLIGLPYRAVVGTKARDAGGIEFTDRTTDTVRIVSVEELVRLVAENA
ncbi:MAG: aminoacyl--tRNA ligase-related protein [Candidatus Paceibacterota bacterium]